MIVIVFPTRLALVTVPVYPVLPSLDIYPAALVAFKVPLATEVAVAAPSTGVTNVGVSANTRAPVPVSSVTAVLRLALLAVPRNVDIPEANPVIELREHWCS